MKTTGLESDQRIEIPNPKSGNDSSEAMRRKMKRTFEESRREKIGIGKEKKSLRSEN